VPIYTVACTLALLHFSISRSVISLSTTIV
jgi:hypothetical protein